MSLINKEDLMLTLGITDMDCEKCGWYSKAARMCKRGSDFEDACCAIDDAPTIEPERKKGIWKNRSLNILYPEWERYECSVCGGYSYIHKYCPNCGAKMEGCEQNG